MQEIIAAFAEDSPVGKLLSSLLLALVVSLAYRFASAAIRRAEWSSVDACRRWQVMARNTALLIYLLLLVVIWASQLRTLALSVVGFAVAIVLVTKELITCVTGGFLRSSMRLFRVGDRIEIKGFRGDVIDLTMLTTSLLEIGPNHQYTGRAVVLPNSIFLTDSVINETFTEHFVLNTTVIPLAPDADWRRAEQLLLRAAQEVSEPYLGRARQHLEAVGKHHGIEVPSADPRIILQLPRPKEINLLVRYPAPSRQKSRTEQDVLRRFLELVAQEPTQDPQLLS